jgi:hypothetical protein
MKYRITAPNRAYNGVSAGVRFTNGEALTGNPRLLSWFRAKGYTVAEAPETFAEAMVKAESEVKEEADAGAKEEAEAAGKADAEAKEEAEAAGKAETETKAAEEAEAKTEPKATKTGKK